MTENLDKHVVEGFGDERLRFDRFGTRLEKRFSKIEIEEMIEDCGFERIKFSETSFWTAVGFKK
jgi:hypothetical protein